MQTVAELPEFIRRVSSLLSDEERQELVIYLATFPKAGIVMTGTGGIRKLRWARQGMGKSSGIRVIYYFYNEDIPLYLLTVFGKNEKDNLSKAERNDLTKLVRLLVQYWRDRHE